MILFFPLKKGNVTFHTQYLMANWVEPEESSLVSIVVDGIGKHWSWEADPTRRRPGALGMGCFLPRSPASHPGCVPPPSRNRQHPVKGGPRRHCMDGEQEDAVSGDKAIFKTVEFVVAVFHIRLLWGLPSCPFLLP